MIHGIGVDCVKVDRIAQSMEKPRFAKWVFSPAEQALLEKQDGEKRNQTAAGCFAAKEAFMKAAGVGLGGFTLSDMAALRKESGAPYYEVTGTAAAYLEKNGLRAHLSITNEDGMAIAFAVFEAI